MNVSNFRATQIKPSTNFEAKKHGGITLEKNGQSTDLYFISKAQSVTFYENLRPFLIFTDFQNHYILNKLIGKGSFARVSKIT